MDTLDQLRAAERAAEAAALATMGEAEEADRAAASAWARAWHSVGAARASTGPTLAQKARSLDTALATVREAETRAAQANAKAARCAAAARSALVARLRAERAAAE